MPKSWSAPSATHPLSPLNRFLFLVLSLFVSHSLQGQEIFVNEIHYDNAGQDLNEFIEILGPAGTDLSAYHIVLYNGSNGRAYRTIELRGRLGDEGGSGFGTIEVPISGLQNGSPDGIALYRADRGAVNQFLSYEGAFTASDGVANGLTSTPIPVNESSSAAEDESLQLKGEGTVYNDFTWSAPAPASPGAINAGQQLLGNSGPTLTLSLSNMSVRESSMEALSLLINANPPPDVEVSIALTSSQPERLPLPETVTLPASGERTLLLQPVDNDITDEVSTVTIEADAGGMYPPTSTMLTIIDDDRPQLSDAGVIRVVTFNVLNGVGNRGTPPYEAVKAILIRLNPDIIAFQEVSSIGNFRLLKTLLNELGFDLDREHLATVGDAFVNQQPVNGEFSSDQFVVIASRYPIRETIQIGRGNDGRRELTRYPLYVEVDVPNTENDPALITVHLKAGRTDEDEFRRAVEAYRIIEFLEARNLNGSEDPIIVLGDFNENRDLANFHAAAWPSDTTSFSDGSRLPPSYQLGSDLASNSVRLPYRRFPDQAFSPGRLRFTDARHADRRANGTFIGESDSPLDYVFVSDRIRLNGPVRNEVFNSLLDVAYDGVPKAGGPVALNTSELASDHYAVLSEIPLESLPRMNVELDDEVIAEGGADTEGMITLLEPASNEVTVDLSIAQLPVLAIAQPSQVVIPPGETTATFAFTAIDDGLPNIDRRSMLQAKASGYRSEWVSVEIRNHDPSGKILITQYREPPSLSAGRAVELLNRSGGTIDLSETPLILYRYTNGSTMRTQEIFMDVGEWPDGQVLVIGDQATRNYLLDENFLSPTTTLVDRGSLGSGFLEPDGELPFIRDNLGFDGNDALEIQLGWERADVFGTIGSDPGDAWIGGGVSTRDTNLTLHSTTLGGSSGFDDPSSRFRSVDETTLLGFGEPPAPDAFTEWLQRWGFSEVDRTFDADPDGDGLINGAEFVFSTDPTEPTPTPLRFDADSFALSISFQTTPWSVDLEWSADLITWQIVAIAPIDTESMRKWELRSDQHAGYFRVVIRPL